jgi:hypothetical protein
MDVCLGTFVCCDGYGGTERKGCMTSLSAMGLRSSSVLCNDVVCGDICVGLKRTIVSYILFSVTVFLSLICLPSLVSLHM